MMRQDSISIAAKSIAAVTKWIHPRQIAVSQTLLQHGVEVEIVGLNGLHRSSAD